MCIILGLIMEFDNYAESDLSALSTDRFNSTWVFPEIPDISAVKPVDAVRFTSRSVSSNWDVNLL
jgi:hypothetical protein